MNAKTAHILIEVVQITSAVSAAITLQPSLQTAKWVPITLAVLSIISTVGKTLTIGNITPTNPTRPSAS